MARNPERAIDKTSLSIDQAEARGFIHRDYIAHCLRWSHVCKYLHGSGRYKAARILDVGCGKELPLAKLLHSSRLAPTEGWYVGVDPNKLPMPEQFANAKWKPQLAEQTNILDVRIISIGEALDAVIGKPVLTEKPNVLVCFEVLEHVQPAMARQMLHKFRELLAPDGVAFISTPVWDPHVGAADNHINEMRFHALGRAILDAGFSIENVWGTFASQRDYKDEMRHAWPDLPDVFERLGEYYDSNYLATIFAPLFPEKSRNCLWRLNLDRDGAGRQYADGSLVAKWEDVPEPWTSSPNWRDLKGE
jgi:2-polyprenyl-3-methyl-5-hydroxy-6-metoxy-1,4-benzoquinol methylase